MGGRGSNSRIPRKVPQPIQQAQGQQPLQPLAPPPDDDDTQQVQPQAQQPDPNGFSDTDDQDFHDLYNGRNYYQQQNLDIDTQVALVDYLDPNEVHAIPGQTGLYNASQEMNYAVAHGGTLDPQQQFMYDTIKDAAHNLGYNLNLTRYDHAGAIDTMLQQVGVQGGHNGLSISQMKNALVGQTFTDDRILSTSYNDFKKASDPDTFTTREVKITYRAKASTQALMPGISPIGKGGRGRGDDFGEMLLAPTGNGHNNYRVVDVKYSGKNARPKGGSTSYLPLRQIEIVIEVD